MYIPIAETIRYRVTTVELCGSAVPVRLRFAKIIAVHVSTQLHSLVNDKLYMNGVPKANVSEHS